VARAGIDRRRSAFQAEAKSGAIRLCWSSGTNWTNLQLSVTKILTTPDRDLSVMSYALGFSGVRVVSKVEVNGLRVSGPFAPHRTDSGRFRRVLFPNLFKNEPACKPLSSEAILDVGLP
jgi:hypothetical protein